jgi:hypothetical protein
MIDNTEVRRLVTHKWTDYGTKPFWGAALRLLASVSCWLAEAVKHLWILYQNAVARGLVGSPFG